MWAAAIDASQTGINFRAVFQTARGRVDNMKQETLAALMGYSEQQLSRELDASGPSLFRLAKAAKHPDPDGRRVVQEIFSLMSDELGFGECDPVAATLASALSAIGRVVDAMGTVQKRMARAERIERVVEQERRRA